MKGISAIFTWPSWRKHGWYCTQEQGIYKILIKYEGMNSIFTYRSYLLVFEQFRVDGSKHLASLLLLNDSDCIKFDFVEYGTRPRVSDTSRPGSTGRPEHHRKFVYSQC